LILGAYLKAVLLRLRAEAGTTTNFDDLDHWLTKELEENGFWLKLGSANHSTIGTSGFGYPR
jgi:hypothetical protein